ncbi:MAG: insulinase family protein [Bacteroidetes bacterium]|nr:insulinase family protein [Bacteroidota bacterium]
MIKFEKFILDNGLKVIIHQDNSSPIVAFNVLYNVGAKDENPKKTGFAHLFEHLMFGGSENIPKYDEPLERVGGENNAFTNSDFTNYYLTLPLQSIETAFWLESDRMNELAFSEKSLDVQRNVVSEEFKQVYLNQPYGDAWLLLKPLAYKVHPYQWNTIGKKIEHVQNATMEDVKDFFSRFYNPNNAILVIAGNVEVEEMKTLTEKWFGSIPKGPENLRTLPIEPQQTEARKQKVENDVPFDVIYKAYHMCARKDENYHATDLVSDILSNGKSSRLYENLIEKQKLFSDINAYLSGDIEEGLFVVKGKLVKGVSMEVAEAAIIEQLELVKSNLIDEKELQKVKNKIESTLVFSEISNLNKAMNLAYYELLGDAAMVNDEPENYRNVTAQQIKDQANLIFREENCSTLYYYSKTK